MRSGRRARAPARRGLRSRTARTLKARHRRARWGRKRARLRNGGRPARAVAEEGFDAWRRGDFDALEQMFAPDVEWRWFEPGDWDCHSRKEVIRTLRQRHAAGFAQGRLTIQEAGSDVVVVTAHPSEIGGPEWPDETSTVIRFREGKVVSMRDYRTEAEALAAAR